MKKLPYIPNKKMYAAVMGACSYVRDTGWFNKAVSYYADKYGVDEKDVAKYVRIAQGNGQKQKNATSQRRKYKWFAVEYSVGNERNGGAYFERVYAEYTVIKGLSPETVKRRICKNDDMVSEYSPCHFFGRIESFESEQEAVDCVTQWKHEENDVEEERNLTDEELSEFFLKLKETVSSILIK